MNKKIFISTGEVSGDLHGSLLARALFDEAKKKSITLEICGLGGTRMQKEGVKIFKDTTSIKYILRYMSHEISCSYTCLDARAMKSVMWGVRMCHIDS